MIQNLDKVMWGSFTTERAATLLMIGNLCNYQKVSGKRNCPWHVLAAASKASLCRKCLSQEHKPSVSSFLTPFCL